MTDKPLVSVNMVTYNHELYIAQAIEGVVQQKTDFAFELVIGEDCSTDRTRDVVHTYRDKHPDIIRLVTSEKNVGAHKNYHRVVKACRGKYIAYCDGDDFWHRMDKIQRQVEYLENHPECGIVYSDYDKYHVESGLRIKGCLNSQLKQKPHEPTVVDILSGKTGILTCTVMARRDMVEQVMDADPYLHQSNTFLMSDTQLWAELSLLSQVHYFDASFATHQLIPESATQSSDVGKKLEFWASNSEMCLYLCKKHNLSEKLAETHERQWLRKSLLRAFFEKNDMLARRTKEKGLSFSHKDWLLYYGTVNRCIRPSILMLFNMYHASKRACSAFASILIGPM